MKPTRNSYHAGLSREVVTDAAISLLQQRGVAGFSVRRLATELGVDAMAVYKHVQNRDDLLGAAVAQVFRTARPAGDGEWWEQVQDLIREQRRVIREQPWVLTVMLTVTLESSEPWSGVEQTLVLMQPHLGATGAARWIRLLAAFTNGFLLSEPELMEVPDTVQVDATLPRVSAAANRNARSGDADFEVGLELLIAGMRAAASERPLRTVRSRT